MKKTTLFRVLTFVLMIGLLSASCSKHTDKPAPTGGGNNGGDNGGGNNGGGGTPQTATYYVKTKMDGAAASFSGTVKALRAVDEDGTHILQIQGIKGNGSADEVDLLVYAAADVVTGDYTEGDHENYAIIGAYAPQNRADDDGIYLAGIQPDAAAPFKISITEIADKYVKGTFSGAFFDGQGNGTNKKVFTEGEFKAPIQQ